MVSPVSTRLLASRKAAAKHSLAHISAGLSGGDRRFRAEGCRVLTAKTLGFTGSKCLALMFSLSGTHLNTGP